MKGRRFGLRAALLAFTCGALGGLVSAQTLPFEDVVAQLESPDADARRGALRQLVEAGYPEAAVPVAALIADRAADLRLEAIAAEVRLLGGRTFPRSRRVAGIIEVRNSSVAETAFRAGPGLPVRPVPPAVSRALIAALGDADARVRLEATFALGSLTALDSGRLGSTDFQDAFRGLEALLRDPAPGQREAAALVAARLAGESRRPSLPADQTTLGDAFINAMNDPDEGVRVAAITALGLMRYERALMALGDQVAHYGRGPTAEAALDALARIAHPSSVPLFWRLVSHRDAGIRRHAVEGVGRAADASWASNLETGLARERSDEVNLALAFALQRLGSGRRLDRLVEAASHAAMRQQARGYLIELGPANAASLTAYLQDPTPGLRAVIADVLGHVGDRATIKALEPFVNDRDPEVASAAARAIARLSRQ